MPVPRGIVIRTTDLSQKDLAEWKPGADIMIPQYVSATMNDTPLDSIVGDLTLVIASKNARDISGVRPWHDSEAEALFNAGTRFRVMEIKGTTFFFGRAMTDDEKVAWMEAMLAAMPKQPLTDSMKAKMAQPLSYIIIKKGHDDETGRREQCGPAGR